MDRFQITEYCHFLVEQFCEGHEFCIDATMGNGTDTLFLCELAGETGQVLAFDIQEQALNNTAKRLEENGVRARASLFLESHEKLGNYAEEGSVDVIMFNFGYLPGGDHTVSTKKATSVAAVAEGLRLLKQGGVMTLCIYSGGDSGYEEKEALLEYIKNLDSKKYLAIVHEYYNRPKDPPLPVLIRRIQ